MLHVPVLLGRQIQGRRTIKQTYEMKRKYLIYCLLLVCVTLACLWLLPALVRKATASKEKYPFVYYSSVLRDFGLIDYTNKQTPMSDTAGNLYTPAQFDSLMPLLNFRQLISDGTLPDSIGGYAATPQLLRSNTVVFNYRPKEVSAPNTGLYILFESMPKRVGLEIPPDVFRLRKTIEFIDAQTNQIDTEKSEMFRKAFDKEGFKFPARWAVGNPNPRKAYDEGYFTLDATGELFHLKMVNGRPYIGNTHAGESIDILSFSIYEAPDKRFYGFIFDRGGNIYILESDEQGGYSPLHLEIDPIDPSHDQVTIMGNLLYWTVTVSTPEGRIYYALEKNSLSQVGRHEIERTPDNWDKASQWLFPMYLTFGQNTSYIIPRFTFTGYRALAANILAATAALLIAKGCRRKKLQLSLYVLITGLAGLLAAAILPGFRKNNN